MGDLARAQDAVLLTDPLLGTPVEHIDDLLAIRW
jgi:hypothetical protein